MVELLSLVGAISAIFTLAGGLIKLARELQRCVETIRNAPREILDFVHETMFFSQFLQYFHRLTIDVTQELNDRLKTNRGKLVQNVKRQCRIVAHEMDKLLGRVLQVFEDDASPLTSFLARFHWYLRKPDLIGLRFSLKSAMANVHALVSLFTLDLVLKKENRDVAMIEMLKQQIELARKMAGQARQDLINHLKHKPTRDVDAEEAYHELVNETEKIVLYVSNKEKSLERREARRAASITGKRRPQSPPAPQSPRGPQPPQGPQSPRGPSQSLRSSQKPHQPRGPQGPLELAGSEIMQTGSYKSPETLQALRPDSQRNSQDPDDPRPLERAPLEARSSRVAFQAPRRLPRRSQVVSRSEVHENGQDTDETTRKLQPEAAELNRSTSGSQEDGHSNHSKSRSRGAQKRRNSTATADDSQWRHETGFDEGIVSQHRKAILKARAAGHEKNLPEQDDEKGDDKVGEKTSPQQIVSPPVAPLSIKKEARVSMTQKSPVQNGHESGDAAQVRSHSRVDIATWKGNNSHFRGVSPLPLSSKELRDQTQKVADGSELEHGAQEDGLDQGPQEISDSASSDESSGPWQPMPPFGRGHGSRRRPRLPRRDS
ncbi:hypothetical protein F4778DRAFT_722882 [Xylariomycetidae sp. FL2044]|nr:hypothetical protein F4778DRAFT_722882 [Xylariomycetidae sp. FL2044]